MKVWLVESGEYEQRGVVGIYESLEAAEACIKARYAPPFPDIVRWEPLEQSVDGWTLTAHFEKLNGYSVGGPSYWDIQPVEVQGMPK